MKKFLLTLLGASLLCGLSPHPLSAQETASGNVLHMDFNKRADGHNEDLHFYGKLQTLTSSGSTEPAKVCTFYEPDTRFEWPTAAAGVTVKSSEYQSGKPFTYTYSNLTKNTNYSAATNYAGVKRIENEQLKLEFNYMWALAKNYTQNNTYKTNFTSQIRITETEGGLYLYPGVTFKITTKNGKKIKKLTLKTPYSNTLFTPDRRKAAFFVYQTPEGTDDFSSITSINTYSNSSAIQRAATVTDGTYEFNNGSNTINRATIEITLPETYPGENSDIVLGLKKDQIYPWNHTGTAPYNFAQIKASSSGSNINTLCEPFAISAIDIEYYGDEELPKYVRSVTCGIDNNDKVEVEQNGGFVDITNDAVPTTLSDETVKLRIGDAIVEIARTASTPSGKPTVTFDKALNRVGVHAYATIKTYPDPEKYKYNGTAATPYKMTYLVHGFTAATGSTITAASESSKNMSFNQTPLKEKGITYAAPINKEPEIISLSTTAGIPNDITLTVRPTNNDKNDYWGVPDSPNSNTAAFRGSVAQGTRPAFVFDGISFIVPSDTPNPPLKPTAKPDLNEAARSGGVWHSARPFTLTLAPKADEYDNHLIQYIISEEPTDELDWESAKEYTTPLSIEKSCYVYARISSDYEGKTYSSAVETVIASILNPIKIASLTDLHKAENDGKTVMLQIPLTVTTKADVYPQSTTAGYTQAAYLRDIDGTGVKVISRRTASSGSGNEALPVSYDQAVPSSNSSGVKTQIMPENTVVGVYRYNDGKNPCIVVRDKMAEPAIDYQAYQGNTQNEIDNAIQVRQYAADKEYNTFASDLYAKRVIVRGLKWNSADQSLTAIAADDNDPMKTVKIRIGESTNGALSVTTLPTLSEDKIYDVQAILEYDAEANEYFLAPIKFYEQFEMPLLTGPDKIKDKLKNITDENDDTKVIGAEYTDDFMDGDISLEFQMEKFTTGSNTTINFYSWSVEQADGTILAQSPSTTYDNTFTASFTTSKLKFDEDGSATVYAYCQYKGYFNTCNSGQRFKIVIRDAVQSGPEVASTTELREKINSGEIDPAKGIYVTFDGRFAVVAKYGKTLLIRDVSKDLPLDPAEVSNPADIKKAFSSSYLAINEDGGWPNSTFPVRYCNYEGKSSWSWYNRNISDINVGDEITRFIGKVSKDSNGNLTVDLTGLQSFFSSYALNQHVTKEEYPDCNSFRPGTSVKGFNSGTPRFMPYMTTGEKDANNNWIVDPANPVTHPLIQAMSEFETDPLHPDNVKFDDSMLDTELHVMNVAIREKASDDPDAEKEYEAVMTADGVTLLWDMFGTDVDPDTDAPATAAEEAGDDSADNNAATAMSVKKQLAAHLANGEKAFNVLGVLRKYNSGYALQVEEIVITPEDVPATFFADGEKIDGYDHKFVKRIDLTTDMPDEALIKMTVGDGEQEAYDPEKLKGIEADTKVTIERWVPGTIKILPTTITLTKLSTDVNTLAEMAKGDNANNLYHFRKHLKVVAAAEGTVLTADKEGNLTVVAAAPAKAAEGKYLTDIVLVRNGKNTASIHEIDADAELLDEDDSYAISTPATTTLFGATVAEGNATDAEGNVYTIDPTFAAIPQGDAEAWSLTGYILPGADDKPVIYLTASKAIDRVKLPVITPAEAAFLDQTTFTIDCATTGASIEYSLDGGKTWLPYNGDAVKVEATCEILARATAAEMLPSHEATASVVREYLSGDVNITVDEQNGQTVITITGPGKIYYSIDGAAEKLYDGEITIDNDTQAELSGTIRAYAVEEGKRAGNPKEESYKVSGISGVGADEAESISVEGNTIIVPEGAQTFDIAGRRVNPQGLPRGIYIVRLASGKAVKAVVK